MPIAHTGLPLIVIETGTGIGIGIGTATVIVIEGRSRLGAAGDMRDTTHLTLVDIPLPRVVTSEAQTNTDPVATAKAHATENAPQGTEMTITARDLPPIGTDPPARGPTVMTMMKTLKSVGDVDVRGGIVTGIGIVIGENPTICQINRRVPMTRPRCVREVTTEVMLGVTSTTLQVYTRAIIDTGMTMTRCPLRIIL